jgi:hypothetical protein
LPVIPGTKEAEIGGSQFEARSEKVTTRPYLKNKLKTKKGLRGREVV